MNWREWECVERTKRGNEYLARTAIGTEAFSSSSTISLNIWFKKKKKAYATEAIWVSFIMLTYCKNFIMKLRTKFPTSLGVMKS